MKTRFALVWLCLLNTGSAEVLVDARAVPNPLLKQGEVRILAREHAAVVQSVLHTRFLKRVAGHIRKQELAAWPDGHPLARERARYLAALDRACRVAGQEGGKASLRIEFVWLQGDPHVALYVPGEPEASLAEKLTLDRAYLLTNMLLIVQDAFSLPPAKAARILRRAGWPGLEKDPL